MVLEARGCGVASCDLVGCGKLGLGRLLRFGGNGFHSLLLGFFFPHVFTGRRNAWLGVDVQGGHGVADRGSARRGKLGVPLGFVPR